MKMAYIKIAFCCIIRPETDQVAPFSSPSSMLSPPLFFSSKTHHNLAPNHLRSSTTHYKTWRGAYLEHISAEFLLFCCQFYQLLVSTKISFSFSFLLMYCLILVVIPYMLINVSSILELWS